MIITANRDESPERKSADFPAKAVKESQSAFYPQDGDKGGTWIASTSSGKVVNLMNGAFEAHQSNPPYRKSRGLVLLDAFDYESFERFSFQASFEGIEPFTMVCFEPFRNGNLLAELRWDGRYQHYQTLDPDKPYLWTSASLYSQKSHDARNQYFHQYLATESFIDSGELMDLHREMAMGCFEADFSEDGNLPPVQTLSCTQVEISKQVRIMRYRDLKHDFTLTQNLFANR